MRVLIACDKFKDALPAPAVCATISAALRVVHPEWRLVEMPLTDGGDGFATILTRAAGGQLHRRIVRDPRGRPVRAAFGTVEALRIPKAARMRLGSRPAGAPAWDEARVGIVELAEASGLHRLSARERDPWLTTTTGTGELLAAAAASGVAAIVIGLGGSATNDLGLGMLQALGWQPGTRAGGWARRPCPAGWGRINRIVAKPLAILPPIYVACDVDNPLLGPRGAAATFAPQKGLAPKDLPRMERASARMARLMTLATHNPPSLADTPGAGAAGGAAFGLLCTGRACLLPGSALVHDWLDLDRMLAEADLVITGEGRWDASSLAGKGPGALVRQARARGLPVHVFAGSATADGSDTEGLRLHAISPPQLSLATALHQTRRLLARSIGAVFG